MKSIRWNMNNEYEKDSRIDYQWFKSTFPEDQ